MSLTDLIQEPELVRLYGRAVLAGLCMALMCGVLSVPVVLKRLSFVGQGISHAAFGGIGLALLAATIWPATAHPAAEFGILLAFCVAAALGISVTSDPAGADRRRALSPDAAIGIFLVGSMAAGGLLVQWARVRAGAAGSGAAGRTWESILFGSIFAVGPAEVWLGLFAAVIVLCALLLARRPMLFWALDEAAAPAFGVRTGAVKALLLVLLALAVVTATKLAGVVLATALLVLPGAVGLRLSSRLGAVFAWSVGTATCGLLAGLYLSLRFDWQPGPSIVLVLVALLALVSGWSRLVRLAWPKTAPTRDAPAR
ncbi:MAG TPA: metal ABC transporter permease [Phycisphaerales bacterium]|nr:metal ABC transporter permease [Phycisphaerales bacterium]